MTNDESLIDDLVNTYDALTAPAMAVERILELLQDVEGLTREVAELEAERDEWHQTADRHLDRARQAEATLAQVRAHRGRLKLWADRYLDPGPGASFITECLTEFDRVLDGADVPAVVERRERAIGEGRTDR